MTAERKRELPGHIAAALAGAGGSTDSAGQNWAGRELPLGEKYHNFDADDGGTPPEYASAISALVQGTGSEREVVEALATARVFIPIVAQLAEQTTEPNGLVSDKESDMALVTIQAPDGRRALPVFTNVQALVDWHPQARPVAVYAARAALSAVAEQAQMLVLDPGSDRPFVVRRPAMWSLAQQNNWVPSYQDPVVGTLLRDSIKELADPSVLSISTTPDKGIESLWDTTEVPSGRLVRGGGVGPELSVTITLQPGLDQSGLESLINALQSTWASKEYFAQAVDSVQVRLRHPEPTP